MKRIISLALTLFFVFILYLTGCNNASEKINSGIQSENGTNQESESPTADFEYSINEEAAAIKKYIGRGKMVVVPEKIEGKPVSMIGTCAFMNQSIEKVVVPSTVTLIWNSAFANCTSLKEVIFGDGITEIMEEAFRNCTALTEVKLPKNLEKLGTGVFKDCSALEKVFISKNANQMGMEVFFGCPISEFIFEDGIKTIGSYAAFWSKSPLKNIIIPASVEKIREYSFHDNLESVTFLGDAPKEVEKQPFGTKAVIYYKKGANGWEDTPLRNEYTLIEQN